MVFDALDPPHAAPTPHCFIVVVSSVFKMRAAAVAGKTWPTFIAVSDEPMSAMPPPSMVPALALTAVHMKLPRRCQNHAVGVVPTVNAAIFQEEVTAPYQTPSASVAEVSAEYSPHASTTIFVPTFSSLA